MIKRLFDLLIAVMLLSVLLPVCLCIAVAVVIDSKGPVFYRGVRAGRNGIPFKIFKFRTMVVNAELLGGGTTALRDPRITRVGAVLRKFKLDEFPQILNVLKGDMSLVGPRPELLQYAERYNNEEKKILSVRPGITDFSSIEFHSLDECVGAVDADRIYEETVLPRKNLLRIKYVEEQSLRLDITIIAKTAYVIIRKVLKTLHRGGAKVWII